MRRRVVITGVGLVIPTGIGVETSWKHVCGGRSGIGPLTRFDTDGFETKIAGEVKGFNPETVRKDLLAFFAGKTAELADYVLVTGRPPKQGSRPATGP